MEGDISRRDALKNIVGGLAAAVVGAGSDDAEARVMKLEGNNAAIFEKDLSERCTQGFAGQLVGTNAVSIKIKSGGANTFGPLTLDVYNDNGNLIGEVFFSAQERGSMHDNTAVFPKIRDLLQVEGYLKK